MSSVRDSYEQLVAAAQAGDSERVIERWADLTAHEPLDPDLLAEFESAVRDDDHAAAEALRYTIEQRYELRRRDVNGVVETAKLVRDGDDLDVDEDDRDEARRAITLATKSAELRAEFARASSAYLGSEGEAVDGEQLLELTATFREHLRTVDEQLTAAESVIDDVSLPPELAFLDKKRLVRGTVGEPIEIDLVLRNLGDEPIEDVAAQVSTRSDATIEPAVFGLEELGPRAEAILEFGVDADDAGTKPIGVDAESATAGAARKRLRARFANNVNPLVDAYADENGAVDFEAVADAIDRYAERELIPGTDDERVLYQHVLELVERYEKSR